ncbi:hypothetical protein [Haloarcula sediminis]|uniref:hypothetical protein n=1 Tax=Haloarcula sediminis TaxID=3111777 RepID=UPI002D77B846|nr:hypothetical protein [Haloarcula sp. CK38]
MTAVEVGEVVSLTELDSEPALLVLAVEEDLTGALLADLANETIQRLEATVGDREGRREIAQAVANAEDIMTFAVPPAEVAHRNGPGIQGCGPPQGGGE